MIRRRPVLSAVTVVYLLVVGYITLTPHPVDTDSNRFVRDVIEAVHRFPLTSWVTYLGVEFTANIVMFVPMGLLFTLLLGVRRWWLALLIGVFATCLIEGIQSFMPTRYSEVRDLVSNTLGTAVGIGIVALTVRIRRPVPARE